MTHGLPTVYESMLMLQRMPIGEIMRVSLLGRHERMSADAGLQIGLVQEVVAAGDLMACRPQHRRADRRLLPTSSRSK